MSTNFLQSRNGFYSQLRAWVPESDAPAELAAPSAELRGANGGEASKLPFSWIIAQADGSLAGSLARAVVAARPATDPALRIDNPFAISLTGSGVPYTQNFDALAQTGTSSTLPADWAFSEAGTNANTTYSAGTGSGTGGDTWSYGVAGTNPVTDRAFGTLASNNLQSTIGASFTNNTGATIESLLISYTGEQWRRGGNTAGVTDRLDFAISFNATSLTTGTWTEINSLDFVSVIATAAAATLDGNNAANRIAISSNITSLAIANGATFWIRWVDPNISGNDDGLAIDDFSLTPTTQAGSPGTLDIADSSVTEGNSGTTQISFTVTRSGGTTGAVSANWTVFFTGNAGDASPSDLAGPYSGTVSFADGETSRTITIDVNGDTDVEPNEIFTVTLSGATGGVALGDASATGTINDDDAISVTINDVSIVEGDSGTQNLVFTVTRTGGSGAFDVNFETVDGTAISTFGDPSRDYVTTTGTINFLAGQNTATISVPIFGDTLSEPNQSFQVQLTSATNGAIITDATGTGTILNDDFTLTFIHDIQGTSYWSPILAGDGITAYNTASTTTVTIRAVVTALDGVGSRQGFYITEEVGDWDANPFTSEGIFVMTRNDASVGSTLAAAAPGVAVGDIVTLTAQVMEYQAFANMPRTMLVNATSIVTQSTGNTLPTLTITSAPNSIMTGVTPDYTDSSDGAGDSFDASLYALSFWETVEGMLVTIPNMVVADGFVSTSGGRPYLQAYSTTLANPEQINSRGGYTIGGDPPNSPPNSANPNDGTTQGGRHIHDGDVNPDIIEVDFTDFATAPPAGLTTAASMGDRLGDLTGIIDFDFEDRKLFVTSVGGTGFVDNGAPAVEVTSFGSDARSLTVATFNVENLGGTAAQSRFDAIAAAIKDNLKSPDIICVEEIQDNNATTNDGTTDASTTWGKLVAALNLATGKTYQWVDQAPANNSDGGATGGNIRVGFLYDTGRVQLGDLAANATLAERRQYTDRIGDGVRDSGDLIGFDDSMLGSEIAASDWSTTRKSLLGEFNFNGNKVFVVANHWPSKLGSGDFWQLNQDITAGNPTNSDWAQRNAIGQDVYAMLNMIETGAPNVGLIAGGDFNEFYFNRPLEVVTGYVTTDGAARVGGSRFDNLMVTELVEAERYSYVFDGRSQGLDTILANARMSAIAGYDIVHINTGYNSNGPDPLSDHEPSVATFDFRNYAERLTGTAGADSIDGAGDDDIIFGLGGNDTLIGGAGNDILYGGPGVDAMSGGTGNDIFVVDDAADGVSEAAGEGNDLVFTSANYTLAAGQEIETLSTQVHAGEQFIDLTGNEFANTLFGNFGANLLDGKSGADTMIGLSGNDTYTVDNAGDVVVENAGGGNDVITTSVSYALAGNQEVETLATADQAGTAAINLVGNQFGQTLTGNAGANYLNGNSGADTMVGLAGDDTYVVDDAGDVVTEAAGGGTDFVFTRLSYALAGGQEIETLSTAFHAGTEAIDLTGNEFANLLIGNFGANLLDGKGGNDTLRGLNGADSFAFTTALGANNVDTIADFSVADDTMLLDDAVFAGLSAGALAPGAFVTGSAAADADDRIIYDSATGALYFDADGNDSGAAVQFATLSTGLALTASDFIVI